MNRYRRTTCPMAEESASVADAPFDIGPGAPASVLWTAGLEAPPFIAENVGIVRLLVSLVASVVKQSHDAHAAASFLCV